MAGLRDEATLALEPRLEPCEHLVERAREAGDLVVALGLGKAVAVDAGRDLLGALPHRLHRTKRGPCEREAGERREEQGDRTADRELGEQRGDGLVAVVERHAGDDDRAVLLGDEQAHRPLEAAHPFPLREEALSPRALDLLTGQRAGRAVAENLDEPFVVADARAGPGNRGRLRTAAKALVELLVEGGANADVQERSEDGEHDCHRDGEHQGQAEAQPQPIHVSARSR